MPIAISQYLRSGGRGIGGGQSAQIHAANEKYVGYIGIAKKINYRVSFF